MIIIVKYCSSLASDIDELPNFLKFISGTVMNYIIINYVTHKTHTQNSLAQLPYAPKAEILIKIAAKVRTHTIVECSAPIDIA